MKTRDLGTSYFPNISFCLGFLYRLSGQLSSQVNIFLALPSLILSFVFVCGLLSSQVGHQAQLFQLQFEDVPDLTWGCFPLPVVVFRSAVCYFFSVQASYLCVPVLNDQEPLPPQLFPAVC